MVKLLQGILLMGTWLAAAVPLSAQQVASDPPQQWQADARANRQAQKAAEKAADAASPPAPGKRGGSEAPPDGARPSGDPPGGGGGFAGSDSAGGGFGGEAGPGGGGGPGGPGGKGGMGGPGGGGSGRGTPASMLRPEMDFAAPLKDTLILYRSREAVVFGRKESDQVVILPLSGDPVTIAPGVSAKLHEDNAGLRVEIVTSNETHVNYRYSSPSAGVLKVKVLAEGSVPRPGSRFEVERSYQLDAGRR
jgi:hypothetical protein